MPPKKHWPPGNTAQRPPEEEEGFVIADCPLPPAVMVAMEGGDRPRMEMVTFHLMGPMLAGIERLVHAGKYLSRSDAIRDAIRKLLDEDASFWGVGP
jgi:hypothetical protein